MIKSRMMKWAGHVAHMRKKRNTFSVLVEKAKGNRQLVKPRHVWEEMVKIDLKKSNSIVWYCRDWIHLA
jgi:hypothetical protein